MVHTPIFTGMEQPPVFKYDEAILTALHIFLRDNDPVEVNYTLRYLFFDFLRLRHEGLPLNFEEMLNQIESLFELLDDISDGRKLFL